MEYPVSGGVRRFLSRPMWHEPVTAIPGIGPSAKRGLYLDDCYQAFNVLGQYLVRGQREGAFTDWLNHICPELGGRHIQRCYECLHGWCAVYVISPDNTENPVSQKYLDFLYKTIGEKLVTAIPGIDENSAADLQLVTAIPGIDENSAEGFDKAYQVLGQYLVVGQDEVRFKNWLHNTCPITIDEGQSDECYRCLRDWCHICV